MQNTQTLQLFTQIIKTESIYKSNWNAKLEGLVDEWIIWTILNNMKAYFAFWILYFFVFALYL